MIEMKYVVVDSFECGEQLFIFPKSVNHNQFAEVLSYIKEGTNQNWSRVYRKVVSAGFTNGKSCYGRSESLNISSRLEEDTKLLKD